MDENKKTILRAILYNTYNGDINEAQNHVDEIMQHIKEIENFLANQKKLYDKLKEIPIINNNLKIDVSNGKVVFEKGTLVHCADRCNYEKLVNIQENGILSGDLIGISEADNAETFYCADFYRANEEIDSNKLFDRINESDSFNCRGPFSPNWKNCLKLAFIINPNAKLQDLLDTDMYQEKNNNNSMQYMLNLLKDYKTEKYGQVAAIPYGIPSNFISGIVVGDYLLQSKEYMQVLQELFPNCYVLTHNGKVFFDPNISKEANEANRNEFLQNLQQFNEHHISNGNMMIQIFLERAPKTANISSNDNNGELLFTEHEIGKATINVNIVDKDNTKEEYQKNERELYYCDQEDIKK